MKRAMPRTGGAGAVALAAVVSFLAGSAAALAEDPGGSVPPGQIILNPERPGQVILNPPGAAPVTAEEAYEALNGLEPGAGTVSATDCADDGWQVVVVRGSDRAETVRGRLIAVSPRDC